VAAVPPANCVCQDFARQGEGSYGYYGVRYWLTDLAADSGTASTVRIRVYAALKRAGIPLAVPGQTIWVSMDDQQHQQSKADREMSHRVSVLNQLEMFKGLSDEDRVKLAAGMRPAPFSRGEVITRQDSVAHWLYVLTRGECEVRVRGEGGVEKLVARLEAPNVFGEMGVMTGERRTASVVAATEVECYRLDKEIFQGVLRQRPELVDSISQVMARRRVELLSVREDLSAEEKKKRIHEEHRHLIKSIQDFFGLNEKQH
jgi:CRP-like cAMP-binding protein